MPISSPVERDDAALTSRAKLNLAARCLSPAMQMDKRDESERNTAAKSGSGAPLSLGARAFLTIECVRLFERRPTSRSLNERAADIINQMAGV